jgi:hypothetical protein
MKLYKKYPSTPSELKNKYISTLKYCEYMCPGFAWSVCMNYLLECNAKCYVLVTVWEMIVYVYISMGGTKIQSKVMLVPPMVYLY